MRKFTSLWSPGLPQHDLLLVLPLPGDAGLGISSEHVTLSSHTSNPASHLASHLRLTEAPSMLMVSLEVSL